MALGQFGPHRGHSAECRKRLEDIIENTEEGKPRVETAKAKKDKHSKGKDKTTNDGCDVGEGEKVPPEGERSSGSSGTSEVSKNNLSACLRGVDITEMYSPERINQVCHEFGLNKGTSFDLRSGWDFDKDADRREEWKQVRAEDPLFIIGSPPCTMFSALQTFNPALKGNDEQATSKFREELGKARRHVEFCCSLYAYQIQRGRHFLHEHPWGAKSWNMERVMKLVRDPRVMIAKVDLCRFGLEAIDADGQMGPARKRTGFLTSSWAMMEELDGLCNGLHEKHNHLTDGRAKEAAIYPPELCRAVCRGASRQKVFDATNTWSSRSMTRRQLSSVTKGNKWKDEVHEEEGGHDSIGPRPQDGREILKQ